MSQAKRDWKAFDYRTWGLVASPSQFETASDCLRKWWFQKVLRLPTPIRGALELGDVFHECCERWLLADDTGRDAQGNPVEVFPEGWDTRISFGEAALVKKLISKMIEGGVLRRVPGRKVELGFQVPVLDNKRASMVGFVDLLTPFGIEDHKTSKSPRYLVSQKGLLENLQMLCYGHVWGLHFDEPKLELRHNQAITDPQAPMVRATSVDIHLSAVEDFWGEKIAPLAERMLSCKRDRYSQADWGEIPGPTQRGICQKYGGCPFASICGGVTKPDQHKEKTSQKNEEVEKKVQETKKMSEDLLAKLAAKKKARAAGGAASPPPTPPEEPSQEVQEAQEPSQEVQEPESAPEAPQYQEVAPWAQEGCKACSGKGVASNGSACKPCSIKSQAKGILASDFAISAGEGSFIVKRGDIVISVIPADIPEVKAEEKTKPPKAASEAKEQAEEAKKEAKKESKKSDGRGRPRVGMTLLYGLPKRHTGKVVDLHVILQQYGQMLADEWDKQSYWACDAFRRREALAHKAEEIVSEIGTALVVVSSTQRDLLDLASALEPYAKNVYGMIG